MAVIGETLTAAIKAQLLIYYGVNVHEGLFYTTKPTGADLKWAQEPPAALFGSYTKEIGQGRLAKCLNLVVDGFKILINTGGVQPGWNTGII